MHDPVYGLCTRSRAPTLTQSQIDGPAVYRLYTDGITDGMQKACAASRARLAP